MVRVGAAAYEQTLAKPHVEPMEMRGRPMTGWIRVMPEGLRTRRQLGAWVTRAVAFTRTLPPKG